MSDKLPVDPKEGGSWTVEPGDTVDGIADRVGLFWETIWNDSQNADLKEERDHRNVLMPGDEVYVPALRDKSETRETDLIHSFKRKGVPIRIVYQVRSPEGEPFADKDYVMRVGKRRYEGKTDAEGKVDKFISPSAKSGKITVTLDEPGYPETLIIPLKVGSLAPVDTVLGMQQRLNLLNYGAGEETGEMTPESEDALRLFLEDHDLSSEGGYSDDAQSKLLDEFGV